MKLVIQILLFMALLGACGSKNVADCDKPTPGVPCQAQTDDEKARVALNNDDMETAVTILKELVAKEPEKYDRYPLLAAALAGLAGFDVFGIVKGKSGSSSSLLETMGSFIPTPASKGDAYDTSLANMKLSVDTLNTVPVDLRKDISASSFAASCSLQLILYQSAYSVMLINKFAFSASGYDPSKLANMTAADAAAILSNLAAAGSVAAGATGTASSAAVTAAIAAIQAEPGATDQEKIAAYVQANHK